MARRRNPAGCPCGLPVAYDACCGPFHRGSAVAPTAERLMRSRYAAFAVTDSAYLLASWHPDTRPDTADLDPAVQWLRLEVLGTTAGGPLDQQGTVSFAAHYRLGGRAHVQREDSRFARVDGSWRYVGPRGSV